jgi:predicted Zn-dependent protease
VQRLPNEDALSAVLAHEITHVTRQHGIRSISKDRLAGILETAGLLAGMMGCDALLQQATVLFAGAVDEITETLLEKGYSREFEFEADEGASLILARAGLGAEPLEGVFHALDNVGQGTGGWFSTHPSTAIRRSNLARSSSERGVEVNPGRIEERAPVRNGRFQHVKKLLATHLVDAGTGPIRTENQS